MFRRFVFAIIAVVLLTLTGCTAIEKSSIWNSGDLFEWVKAQAIDSGCDPETVSLEDWYVPSEEGNVWRGTCVDKDSGEEVSFAIGVDEVWTPAQTNLITTEALKNAS
jgi:hypothetical protein